MIVMIFIKGILPVEVDCNTFKVSDAVGGINLHCYNADNKVQGAFFDINGYYEKEVEDAM